MVSTNIPLTPTTQGMFDRDLLYSMKKGAYLVNTARGRIVDTDALVEVMEAGHLAGYAGDVWYPQPAPADHPWRSMPNHAMTPHVSGTSLEAQKRYADGIRDCLDNFIAGTPIDRDYIIVEGGRVTSPSYSYASPVGLRDYLKTNDAFHNHRFWRQLPGRVHPHPNLPPEGEGTLR